MNKKILIPIIVILIIAAGIGAYFILQKPAPEPQIEKCGDGICDEFEKANPNLCPKDCEEEPKPTPKSSATPTPSSYQDSPFGISIAGFLNDQGDDGFSGESLSLNYMKEVGAGTARFMSKWGGLHWEQVEPKKGVFNWSIPDEHYLKAKENGLDIFINIYPGSPNWDSNSEYTHDYPNDMAEYLKFVKLAAERYDGDGIEDAPGNPKVNTWELLVEVERGYQNQGNKWWGGTPEEYADLFAKTYEAIKSANPDATVMTYGANIFSNIEKGTIDIITKPVLKEIKRLTKDNPNFSFVYAIHYYETSDLNEYREIIEYTRAMLDDYGFENTPIAITDMAPFTKKADPLKEQKLAKDIVITYVIGLAYNIKMIIWAQLSDGLEYGKNFEAGIISNPSMTPQDKNSYKNLGFYTYKLMTEKLAGSDWNNIQKVQESGGVYIYRFTKNGKPIWVAWNDNSQEKQITISGITSNQVKITEAVPKYESGKEVTDYSITFQTETKSASGGKITITLGEKPVFVEEQ